jgi:hypothetical protein
MTAFPELEAALDAAARRHYRRRRRFGWRFAMPAMAVAVACVAALVLAPSPEPVPAPGPAKAPSVPAATLELSHALTLAPATQRRLRPGIDEPVPHAELPAIAAEFERQTPYPPSGRDTFNWAASPADPQDMGSINYRNDIQGLVEFRAGCLWLRYWLASEGAERQAATAVLADVPDWPSRRDQPGTARKAAERSAAGDDAAVAAIAAGDCAGM